ncbi:MAG: hypothetical protein AMXMBFR84_51250 [Candidatus Hydrogenedentota bacterium]
MDDLAAILFPGNRRHQKPFFAIFVEIKWAKDHFLPRLEPVARKHGITPRTLETVRAKMRRLGLIDHVSRFNKRYGYREGWVFSNRFQNTLRKLDTLTAQLREPSGNLQERKDRDLIRYASE